MGTDKSDSDMVTYNLPIPSTTFVGRQSELNDLNTLLTDPGCRLLTLTGPGGIGKTRLALEMARTASGNAFPNGIHTAYLQALTSPDDIVPTIADALHCLLLGEQTPKAQLLDYLHRKQLLLILDNYEHLMDSVGLLSEILDSAPQVKLLVTSRERLRLREEWILDLEGLPYPENEQMTALDDYAAIQLFRQSARRLDYIPKDADATAIGRICGLVEGIPLAIELAAAWVRIMPCAEIAREIEHSLDFLTSNVRNIPEKHRSMRATFEYSWKLLPESTQTVFRRLSVFRGGFRREAAEGVADASLATLTGLMDHSLLRIDDNGRYSLQELLRQYADYQLDRSGEAEAIHDKHCTYYAEFLYECLPDLKGPEQVRALDEIEAEIDNVRTSWRWAVAHGREYPLQQALASIGHYFQMRSRYQEGLDTFRLAVERLNDTENELSEQLLLYRNWFYLQRGLWDQVWQGIEKGKTFQSRASDYKGAALPLRQFIYFVEELGGFTVVQQFFQDHLTAAHQRDDLWTAAWCLHCLGDLATGAGKYTEAQNFLKESVAGFQLLGDRWGSSWSISVLSLVAHDLGNYEESRQYALEHLVLCKEIGDVAGIAHAYWKLGNVLRDSGGEAGTIRRYLSDALRLSLEVGFTLGVLDVFYQVAELLMREGQVEHAVELLAVEFNVSENEETTTADRISAWLDRRKVNLPPDVLAAAIRRGTDRDFETAATDLLQHLSTSDEYSSVPRAEFHRQNNPHIKSLTEREREILQCMADGLNSREVAEKLFLSVTTVRWYVRQIYSKLDVHSRAECIAQARVLEILT
jgi:predicted ATPase/DNA-binding CsgD family transcriptional regulator